MDTGDGGGVRATGVCGGSVGWTQWSFDTDQAVVFVGNAWAAEQPSAYLAPPPPPAGDAPPGSEGTPRGPEGGQIGPQGVQIGTQGGWVGTRGGWIGPQEVYVSSLFGGPPCRRLGRDGHDSVYLPFITNLRVRIVDQDPDQPSGAQGVKIIRLP